MNSPARSTELSGCHPYEFVVPFIARAAPGGVVSVSTYEYRPQSVRDVRVVRQVSMAELIEPGWLERSVGQLGPKRELSFHSTVDVGANGIRKPVFHLPMLDLATSDADVAHQVGRRLAAVIAGEPQPDGSSVRDPNWRLFFSGRSFHLYYLALLSTESWIRFLARALLENPPGNPDIVDSRWVGHRMLAGYGALRWSWRTSHYRTAPTSVIPSQWARVPPSRSDCPDSDTFAMDEEASNVADVAVARQGQYAR